MKAIQNPTTNQYFTLLDHPHFTSNVDIAQRFANDTDATLCIEQFIDSDEGFESFGMIDIKIVNI